MSPGLRRRSDSYCDPDETLPDSYSENEQAAAFMHATLSGSAEAFVVLEKRTYPSAMGMPTIYEFLEYRSYLRTWFQAKKEENPRFSHRAFVRKTGQKSPSLLADVIEGRRNLTPSTTEAFARALGLGASERSFFAALVALDQAKKPEDKAQAWERLSTFKRFREARRLDEEAVACFSNWYYSAVRELVNRPDFIPDPSWIARTLEPEISVAQARRAMEVLFDLGLLEKGPKGRTVQTDAGLSFPTQLAGMALRQYHRVMLDRSKAALDIFGPDERYFCSGVFAVPKELLPNLREELNALLQRIVGLLEESQQDADQVIQVNLNLFPLSKPAAQSRPKNRRRS